MMAHIVLLTMHSAYQKSEGISIRYYNSLLTSTAVGHDGSNGTDNVNTPNQGGAAKIQPPAVSPFSELLSHVRERSRADAEQAELCDARASLAEERLERGMCRSTLRFCTT